ncbi:MAG: nicotinamide-nucleotide amidohydrolase family protein [Propionibacteriales bacterium]|nr:nicotinamide-nucleotide amidohydrolase family protein [Propionibacteriales bacterium]
MRVAMCSVGSELVAGEIIDTNAAWMARRVMESGCRVVAELLVGDDHDAIVDALRWLADRADVLIVSGGLGPTSDDLTRYAIADFAGVGLERRKELVAHLEDVYRRLDRPMPSGALRQADVPIGARIHEPLGSAAGFVLDAPSAERAERAGRRVTVHALPGVPWEYKGTAERDVLPDLVERAGGQARVTRTLHVAGAGESWIGEALTEITDRLEAASAKPSDPEHGIELGFLAKAGEVQVRVTATGPTPLDARKRATAVVEEAAGSLGDAVTSVDERRLEDEIAHLLRARGWTIATAESCTAGRVSAALSSAPGAADYLRGGVVVYAAETAVTELGLDLGPLGGRGLVAEEEVAVALARGARERFGVDLAVATVGVAPGDVAPGGPPEGTAIWAIAGPGDEIHADETYINGDRDLVQTRAAAFALESLRRRLLSSGP